MEFNEFDEFNYILNDINEIYDELECDYQSYIKTRQIVLYKPIYYTLLTYLNCFHVLNMILVKIYF
jgi:hypothetical protein